MHFGGANHWIEGPCHWSGHGFDFKAAIDARCWSYECKDRLRFARGAVVLTFPKGTWISTTNEWSCSSCRRGFVMLLAWFCSFGILIEIWMIILGWLSNINWWFVAYKEPSSLGGMLLKFLGAFDPDLGWWHMEDQQHGGRRFELSTSNSKHFAHMSNWNRYCMPRQGPRFCFCGNEAPKKHRQMHVCFRRLKVKVKFKGAWISAWT